MKTEKAKIRDEYLVDNEYLSIKLIESVRRAEIIAQTAKKRLLVITAYPALYNDRRSIVAKKPCFCGRFGRGDVGKEPCTCTCGQIVKWYRNLRKHYTNALWIEDTFSWRRVTIKNVSEPAKMLLKQVVIEFGCINELTKFMTIAQTVAKMDNQETIQPEHIAEAVSYRSK